MAQIDKSKEDLIEEIRLLNKRIAELESEHKQQQLLLRNEELKQLEAGTEKEREFLEKVINSIGSPLYVIDTDYNVVLSNKVAQERGVAIGSHCYQCTHRQEEPCSGKHGCPLKEVLRTKKSVAMEHIHFDKEGNCRFFEVRGEPIFDKDGRVVQMIENSIDITERKKTEAVLLRDEARQRALLELSEKSELSSDEVANYALEEGIKLTQSTIGYIAFVNEDESVLTMHYWSKTAMAQCATIDKPIVYVVKDTGLWGEAIRQRKAVINNDYAAPHPAKKGTPEGHVKLTRHMNIPVFDKKKIVAVAGVGNKETDYNETDVTQLTLMMNGMWRIISRKRVEEDLREKMAALEKNYKLMVGREMRVIEVKKEVNKLCKELGRPEPYGV